MAENEQPAISRRNIRRRVIWIACLFIAVLWSVLFAEELIGEMPVLNVLKIDACFMAIVIVFFLLKKFLINPSKPLHKQLLHCFLLIFYLLISAMVARSVFIGQLPPALCGRQCTWILDGCCVSTTPSKCWNMGGATKVCSRPISIQQ